MSWEVLITCRQLQDTLDLYEDWFAEHGIRASTVPVAQQLSEAELVEIIGRYDGIVAGDDMITAAVIAAGRPRLKVICKWGIGVDAIDLAAAAAAGIPVHNTPGMFGEEVADMAMGYILMLARGLHRVDRAVHAGTWLKIRGETLAGKTVSILGVGSIGRALARRAVAHGCVVLGHDELPIPPETALGLGLHEVGFEELLERADYLVLACPLTARTRHIINATTLERMSEGARLVNVARGPLVDEAALVAALDEGRIAGAALDVLEVEPITSDNPLRGRPNVILGAHNGSNTQEAVLRTNRAALDHLLRSLQASGAG